MLAKNVGPAKNSVAPYFCAALGDDVGPWTAPARARPPRPPTAGTAPSCPGRRRRTPWPRTGTGRPAGCRAPGRRRSRRRPGWSRAGASPPWACPWCPTCTARTRASPRSVGYTVSSAAAAASALEQVHRDRRRRPAAASGQDAGQLRRGRRGLDGGGGELARDGEQPGAGVAQQFGEAVGVQHRGHRDRDRAHPHRREVDHDELRRVRHQHQHPLLGLQAERAQPGGGPADLVVQLRVAQLAGRAGQRDPLRRHPPASRRSSRYSQALNSCAMPLANAPLGCPGGRVRRGGRSRSRTACR